MNPAASQTALVLSGGGAYGAFEVGVMKVLFAGRSPSTHYRPLNPAIFSGTSIGSLNSAIMVGSSDESSLNGALRLENVWLDGIAEKPGGCGNGVFRLRGDPAEYLDPDCLQSPVKTGMRLADDSVFLSSYFLSRAANFIASSQPLKDRLVQLVNIGSFLDTAPYQDLLREVINEQDIRQSSKKLRITATNWITGNAVQFDNSAFHDDLGVRAVMASTAIPGVFPPVTIGADSFVDGGVVENTPLKPAIKAGATELHVILLDPRQTNVRLNAEPSTADSILRTYSQMLAVIVKEDIETARWVNTGIRALENYRQTQQVSSNEVEDFLKVASQFLAARGVPLKPLTIHVYLPGESLGGALGMLDLRLDPILKMIAEGERVAMLHDCRKSGCVI